MRGRSYGSSPPGWSGKRWNAGSGHALPGPKDWPRHAHRAGRLQAPQRRAPSVSALGRGRAEGRVGPLLAARTPAGSRGGSLALRFVRSGASRRHRRGGGIGGFVHWFVPGGPCYGCVASHLKRSVKVENEPSPDYSQPGGPVRETTIPASKASIQTIASLHALITLALLDD